MSAIASEALELSRVSRRAWGVGRIWRFSKAKPLGAFGAAVLILFCLAALLAPLVAPYGYNESNLLARLEGPSSSHWFGTDGNGRDMFSRVLYGARVSMYVGVGAAVLGTVLAVLVGLTSGYMGGPTDALLQRCVDALMSLPSLVLLLTLMALLGRGQTNVMIGLSIAAMGGNSRVVRSAVLSVMDQPYIEAARATGAGHFRIVFVHVLPNIAAPTIVIATLGLGFAILGEASLSFLGFGVPPPAPSWGGMLNGAGRSYFLVAPWVAIFPGVALSLAVFSVNMFGDALRDVLDPRLRGRGTTI